MGKAAGKEDAILAKVAIVRNCLAMIHRATKGDPSVLDDQEKQDVFVLNLERATQACIDLAHLVIARNGFMLPSSYRQSFQILRTNQVISPEVTERMQKMAGFRNIAIHDYRQLDPAILKSILAGNLGDLEDFCREVLKYVGSKA